MSLKCIPYVTLLVEVASWFAEISRSSSRPGLSDRDCRHTDAVSFWYGKTLAEDVAAAAVEFITGPLLDMPRRVGKPLRGELGGLHSARRVIYRIDEGKRVIVVQDIQHRSNAYGRR